MEVARNICVMYGDNAIRKSTVRKWFSHFKEDCFDISEDIQEDLRVDEDRLNTLIHNDPCQCTRKLANATFAFNGHGSKIWCKGTACSKPKPKKSAGGHMCICACSSSIGS